MMVTYILLNILLSCLDCALAHLEAHLRGRIVHESSKCWMHVPLLPTLTLLLRWGLSVSIATLLLLLTVLRDWWRR